MLAAAGMRGHLGNAPVAGRIQSLPDLIHARAGSLPLPELAAIVDALLSPDLRRGLRMDINRPFGDGEDTGPADQGPGNGLVDDSLEVDDTVNFQLVTGQNQPVLLDSSNGQDVDGNGAGGEATDRLLSRQLLARHLYVLLMLSTDDNFFFPLSEIPPAHVFQTPAWGRPAEQLDDSSRRELKAKKLAQWAINVVDFRDADNIMTGFEFDTNPFDGWDVDGNLATTDDPAANKLDQATGQPQRDFVFGCERPVALITETLAFHDRRVKDTDHDDASGTKRDNQQNPDPTLDQPFIPRGSAFIEVMAIFDPNMPVQSADLFVYQGGKWLLDLGKRSATGGTPVWRLAVTEFHSDHATDNAREKVSDIISEHPDTVSLQPVVKDETLPRTPWNFSLLNQPLETHDVKIERIVWFNDAVPNGADRDRTYTARFNNARLEGFQYAVVGPGGEGAGLRQNQTLTGIPMGSAVIQLPAVRFRGTLNDAPSNVKPAIGIPVASAAGAVKSSAPNLPWGADDRVGFSISEPLFSDAKYYPAPTELNPGTSLTEAYGVQGDNNKKFRALPLDSEPGMPLKERGMLETGTYNNVRTVFLQRLADPTQPFNAQTNPYITVDWMPIDLTVFNGEDRYPGRTQVPEHAWDPDNPSLASVTDEKVEFSTRQRGRESTHNITSDPPPSTNTEYNIWIPVSEDPVSRGGLTGSDNFRHKLMHTLGHLNRSYGNPMAPGGAASTNPYLGAPGRPFPWIRWANRPFTSALELIEVPASTPARLCLEFDYLRNPTQLEGPTYPINRGVWTDPQNPGMREFSHLLNFFRSSTGNPPGGDFYRLFEFVHVPSPFVGTETLLDPVAFQTPASGASAAPVGLRAPFNWVSNYRDPGKVNLNTVNSEAVWRAVKGVPANANAELGLPFADFVATRRGGSASAFATNPIQAGGRFLPTIMPNPFRSGAGGDMVPDLPGPNPDLLKRAGANLTLLRANPAVTAPQFADPATNPYHQIRQIRPAVDANRNAALRYRELERLANLTTSRSNVYAIWITVGYFEVSPNGPKSANPNGGVDPGHPDGYELGAEIGSDTGQIKRHRGFYILDRSIPVGFERGFNHNVDRAIVLKRFIE
jgi:hypothetical protein